MSTLAPGQMVVRSLFFALYRDLAGTGELRVQLPAEARVADLVEHLRRPGSPLSAIPAAPVVAVNMEYAPLSTVLSDGDVVAFIPPVAGG
jgi:molybdopterin converting factor subunit 1